MTLSTKTKESIKTALAMAISYGIALSMDWDRPYWAGFAVAFVSLASVGQSLNKAALRMCGTLAAMVVSLTLVALFAQDRWAFMLGFSLVIGVCCYMMGGEKHQYFWQVTAFVSGIICVDGGTDPVNAFQTAVLRAQETGLGILVYSLITIFLWPGRSSGFDAAAVNMASLQHQLYKACFDLFCKQGDAQEISQLKDQTVLAKTDFDQLLNATQTENYEVWESRDAWQHYQSQVAELMEALERWRLSIVEAKGLVLPRLLPDLEAFDNELDGRFTLIEQTLAGHPPGRNPEPMELSYDEDAVVALGHFDRAAFAVIYAQMQRLERLSRSLLNAARGTRSEGGAVVSAVPSHRSRAVFLPDLDRLASTCRLLTVVWVAFLMLIYGGDIPGGFSFMTISVSLGLALVNMPQVPVSKLFKPVATGVAIGAVLYIFVMPQLSSFLGLGLLIFATTFAICYLYAAPQQKLGRAFGLSMFIVIIGVSNHQTYSFLSVATTTMIFPLLFLVISITAYFPFDFRPEQTSLRLLRRFFRSGEHLISTVGGSSSDRATRLERWRMAFHAREVATLPAKLGTWLPHIDTGRLSGTTAEQLQALVARMQALNNRLQQLFEGRGGPQAEFLMRELREEFKIWRQGIQDVFQNLSENQVVDEGQALRARLDRFTGRLEMHIKKSLDMSTEQQLSEQEAVNFYLLLGVCQGVSEALVDCADSIDAIDWAGWREERF
jgi:uncharacterized membrane protein YccC